MFSVNVPVPGRVERLAADLRPALEGFDRIRDRHTLVLKRLDPDAPRGELETEIRPALSGAPAFEARVASVGTFPDPVEGPGPVVYLAVESPGLREVHDRLVDAIGAVEGLEGGDYVPHVTLARGGGEAAADALERLLATDVEPVAWTVNELVFWDARYGEVTGRVSLPA